MTSQRLLCRDCITDKREIAYVEIKDKSEIAYVEIAPLLDPPDHPVQNLLDLLLRVRVHQLAPSHLSVFVCCYLEHCITSELLQQLAVGFSLARRTFQLV